MLAGAAQCIPLRVRLTHTHARARTPTHDPAALASARTRPAAQANYILLLVLGVLECAWIKADVDMTCQKAARVKHHMAMFMLRASRLLRFLFTCYPDLRPIGCLSATVRWFHSLALPTHMNAWVAYHSDVHVVPRALTEMLGKPLACVGRVRCQCHKGLSLTGLRASLIVGM